jgi:release factor glutamine methyltransferase
MKTLSEILKLSTDFLEKRGIGRARREVEELLSYVLHLPRIELYMQFDRPMVEEELIALREAIKRRAEGEPSQYIAGFVDFLGCRFTVNKNVLIPRPETEILADRIIKELPAASVEIWDVCTGSGCIGIALKKKRPDCKVALSDISAEALAVARANAVDNLVDVELLQGDLLKPFQGRQADIIVCNPPYISEKDYPALDREVRDWEPRQALVGGAGGLEFYQRLALELPPYLQPGGKIYLEIGTKMGEQIKSLFDGPIWKSKHLMQDWSSHDRYLIIST